MFFSSCSSFGNFTLLFSSTTAQNCQKLPSAAVVLRSAIVLFCFVLSACKICCPLFCLPNDDDDDDDDGRRNARWGEVRIQRCVVADTVDSNSTDRRVGAQQANELENRQADSNEPHHHHHHQPLLLVLVIAAKVGKSGKNKNEKKLEKRRATGKWNETHTYMSAGQKQWELRMMMMMARCSCLRRVLANEMRDEKGRERTATDLSFYEEQPINSSEKRKQTDWLPSDCHFLLLLPITTIDYYDLWLAFFVLLGCCCQVKN